MLGVVTYFAYHTLYMAKYPCPIQCKIYELDNYDPESKN